MQRTPKQQAALEVYCKQMAEALNNAGFDQKATIELFTRIDLPNTQESVKDVFRACMVVGYPEKRSRTELNTMEIQHLYDVVNRAFSTRAGISIDWPSTEPPMIGDYIEHSRKQANE